MIQALKDGKLAFIVAIFVMIDIIILLIYIIVGGLRGDLKARLVLNQENPTSEMGVSSK